MTCDELEALRVGLSNVLGGDRRAVRDHATAHLEDPGGPIAGLRDAETLADLRRHLDAALIDLEREIAATDPADPEYDYLRGRLIAVRDAERALDRLEGTASDFLAGLGETHDLLHETFPGE